MISANNWCLSEVQKLKGFSIEWSSPSKLLLSKRNRLYSTTSLNEPPEFIGAFPSPLWRRLGAIPRLGQRFLRFMYYNVLPLEDGSVFVTFDRFVGVMAGGECRLLDGLQRPCRVLRSGCAVVQDGSLFFGEYLMNWDRGPILIYRYTPGTSKLEVAYEFAAGKIRHVHRVHWDPLTNEIWIMSGDLPSECRIMRTSDQFKTLDVVGEGDESWRCLSPIFTERYVFYATDSEFQQNYIYRLDRVSRKRDVITEIDGPVYYSHCIGRDMFFATTAVPCPSQRCRSSVIWHVREDGTTNPVVCFKKDAFPAKFFLAGIIHFPGGPGTGDGLYFNGVALAGGDDRTFILKAGG
jgi:hypothetical protein